MFLNQACVVSCRTTGSCPPRQVPASRAKPRPYLSAVPTRLNSSLHGCGQRLSCHIRQAAVQASATGGSAATSSSVLVDWPQELQLTKPVRELWSQLEGALAAGLPISSVLGQLYGMDRWESQLRVWHVLPLLRPHFKDMGGTLGADVIREFVEEGILRDDYSPMVWALGLQERVVLDASSPLPPSPQPPLSTNMKRDVLIHALDAVYEHNDQLALHLPLLTCVLEQLLQREPEALPGEAVTTWHLWRICYDADAPCSTCSTFWGMVRGYPILQAGACQVAPFLHSEEVQLYVEGLLEAGLLAACSPADIWWWVARLDNAAGDRDMVLQLLGTLALQQPDHGALDYLGPLLLQYARKEAPRKKPRQQQQPKQHPRGDYGRGRRPDMMASRRLQAHVSVDKLAVNMIPKLTCRMSGSEVVEWVERLQTVWTPARSQRLLLQLLVAPDQYGMFSAADRLRLQQLAQQRRQQQQQQ